MLLFIYTGAEKFFPLCHEAGLQSAAHAGNMRPSMNTLSSILSSAWLIVLVILFFNLMVFVHELGHFLAARWRGAYVDRFQIWFGKPLWQKEIGGVKWGLGWIPAGGFVSLPQMADMEAIEGQADVPADLKPLRPLDKIIVAAAGPLFSLLLAFAFACVVWVAGKPASTLPGTTIGYIIPNSPAAKAGLLPGDRILAIDGQRVDTWTGNMEGVTELVALSEHERIRFDIERGDERLTIESTYRQPETKWWQRSGMRKVGIMPATPAIVGEVLPGSPAEKAGLKPDWVIKSVNGQAVYTPVAVAEIAEKGGPLELELSYKNHPDVEGLRLMKTTLTPEIPANWQGLKGARPVMGFTWGNTMLAPAYEHPTPTAQVWQSLKWMGITLEKVAARGSSVGMEHLSGPVGIGTYLYRMMELDGGAGWRLVLWFAVVLNVNLAVLNILPFPVLDGGHVVLGFAEMLRGKPVQSRILDWLQTAFVLLLLTLFLFITFKDVGDTVGTGEEETPKLPAPRFTP